MKFNNLKHNRIFEIFSEICSVPRGSGNCQMITEYCVSFAKKLGLKHTVDNAGNVIVYKDGTKGYENSLPVILQGHIDMVCQKTTESSINFETDGLEILSDDDYIFANGTTLGGDNGIAVAMIFYILESNDFAHPPIEAVFTTDEEIGMIGAGKLDTSFLKSERMINLDAEEDDSVIVSCAGGSDVNIQIPVSFITKNSSSVTVEIKGLKGGHSGVEINSGRINSNILAGRVLNGLSEIDFDIVSINGGNKGNAITNLTKIKLCCDNPEELKKKISTIERTIYNEIKATEPNFYIETTISDTKEELNILTNSDKHNLIFVLGCIPNGVVEMSREIDNLVETSLNLGILETNSNSLKILTALRSNKQSSLFALIDKIKLFFSKVNCSLDVSGFYPPWEFNNNSVLQTAYVDSYNELVGAKPKIEAIHAGLECAVFASKIKNIDCIAIGPNLYDVHTVNERLSISSTIKVFEILIEVLRRL